MLVMGLELSLACVGCGASTPVNAYVGAVACHQCERRAELDATAWHLILADPLRDAATLSPGVERASTLNTAAGVIRRIHRTGDATCVRCGASVEMDRFVAALGAPGGHAHCPRCQSAQPLRPAPEALAASGVAAIACESEEQLAGGRPRKEPVALACTSCGGGLSVDGSSRVVTCPFCKSEQYLPNELFASLRSVPVRRWSLLLRADAAAQPQTARATWGSVYHAVLDATGNLFVLCDAPTGGGKALLCMSLDMTLRWTREGVDVQVDEKQGRLVVTPTGHVLVWDHVKAWVVQPSDGATVLEFGQPGGQALETRDAGGLAVAPDGTIVTLSNGHLRRTDAFGKPLSLWGAGQREAPIEGGHETSFLSLGDKPRRVDTFTLLGGGWDGCLHLTGRCVYDDALQAAAYSREGKLRHIAKCPISFNPGVMGRPAMIDARGTTYFAVYQYGKGERGVFRAPPEGRAGPWLMPQSEGGVLGDENAFALGPDGTIVALGRSGQMRVFGPDARVVFLSPACERHDSGQTVVPIAKLAPDIEAQIKEEVARAA